MELNAGTHRRCLRPEKIHNRSVSVPAEACFFGFNSISDLRKQHFIHSNDDRDCPTPRDQHVPSVHPLDGGTAIELGVDHVSSWKVVSARSATGRATFGVRTDF